MHEEAEEKHRVDLAASYFPRDGERAKYASQGELQLAASFVPENGAVEIIGVMPRACEELRLGSPSCQDETVNLEHCMDVVMLGRDLNVRDAGQEGPIDTRITNRMSLRWGTCLMPNPSTMVVIV
ncbi:hypothetical protein GOP47_0013883 [Adiantum capillus-veneris]|uniref:Uncharacterized protein n=1 Tax=Adiantum capillus-veneris TaxID=13818 RepID=A0A9D4ZEZ6_ADICA|nr:hypothetical protein GOP47_0013883 [Adiantum capillus-veneris]